MWKWGSLLRGELQLAIGHYQHYELHCSALKLHYELHCLMVHLTNDVLFEVHNGDRKAIVDIGSRTCTCNRFQLEQLRCAHAIAVLQKANHDPYDYCSPYFTKLKEAMMHAYEETVFLVGHEDAWKVPENIKSMALYPPQGRLRVGRPKKRRCKASWEINAKQREQVKCGSCN
ncbi:uncharacterized protein LOC108212713 [Daucus carota subsp. sativus]|uniref:uncharacterized protein LOC108212713 n=1 Tax=Daucus carota subsp. sativus TaxID=79200 RepID=UPI003082EE22